MYCFEFEKPIKGRYVDKEGITFRIAREKYVSFWNCGIGKL